MEESCGAGARTAPTPPKKRSATTGARSAWLSSPFGCSQVNIQFIMPKSSIASGFSQACRGELGPDRGDRVGERGDDAALAAEDALLLGRREEADVLGQDAVLGLRAGVDGEEGVDQAAQPLPRAPASAASTSATSASSRATCASAISASSWCLSRT